MGLVKLAEDYCLRYHEGQKRKGGNQDPYATHPFAVRDILMRYGYRDPITQAIALLHDTVEDTELRKNKQDIRDRFGDTVYEGVYVLSNNTTTKDAEELEPIFLSLGIPLFGEEGKIHPDTYKMRLLMHPNRIKRVKIADMIHNTNSLPDLSKTGIERKLKDAEGFYIPLGRIVAPIMVKELERNIITYKGSAHYRDMFLGTAP